MSLDLRPIVRRLSQVQLGWAFAPADDSLDATCVISVSGDWVFDAEPRVPYDSPQWQAWQQRIHAEAEFLAGAYDDISDLINEVHRLRALVAAEEDGLAAEEPGAEVVLLSEWKARQDR